MAGRAASRRLGQSRIIDAAFVVKDGSGEKVAYVYNAWEAADRHLFVRPEDERGGDQRPRCSAETRAAPGGEFCQAA